MTLLSDMSDDVDDCGIEDCEGYDEIRSRDDANEILKRLPVQAQSPNIIA
jgi:hypothetical protein